MVNELARRESDGHGDLIEQVVIQGNLAGLSPAQRANYYGRVCQSVGLNPLTRPFEYLTLNGKLILYARKDATDQLRAKRRVTLSISARETIGDLYVVTARATLPDGRSDEEIGAVPIAGLKGEMLANAYMKASTKAKRRVTLSICGLGFLDESEVDSIPGARVGEPDPGPSPRMKALAEEMDAAVAEFEPEPPPRQTVVQPEDLFRDEPTPNTFPATAPGDDPLTFKRGEAIQWATRCREAGIRTADPHPQATEVALDDYIARHRRMLASRAARP